MVSQVGFHTKQEILSQPDVWEKSLVRLQGMEPDNYPDPSDYDQVIFTGCGSTYYLSRWAARVCEKETNVTSRAVPASDLLLFPDQWAQKSRKTLLVAISRSAETTETILALQAFLSNGFGDTTVVTCYPERELARLSPYVIDVPDAQEESVAQTRSFSNMLLGVSWLISKQIAEDLPAQFARVGKTIIDQYRPVAERLGRDQSITKFFFLGSGELYGLANEAMLKMKEMSLSYSECFHTLEFRHGPMSMIDSESLIISLINDTSRQYEYALLRDMKGKGARTLGLMELSDSNVEGILDDQVFLQSGIPALWRAPLYLPVLQLIAYERSMIKGLNPDRPTNLTTVVVLNG